MNLRIIDRARKREIKARKEAEKLLESKSRELYNSMNKLTKANKELEESLLREKKLKMLFLKEKDLQVIENGNLEHELAQQVRCLNEAAIVSETDANGNITFVNDRFCEISGYNRAELIGENHRILKSGKQSDGLFVGMWAAISNGRVWRGEVMNQKKGMNDFYWVDTTIMPFKNQKGKIIKFVSIRFDITKEVEQKEFLLKKTKRLKTSEEKLRRLNQELETNKESLLKSLGREIELNKLKSTFISTASHQFRTPLAIIQSNAELIDMFNNRLKKAEPEKYKKVIDRITKAVSKMTSLMDDVLTLSTSTSGSVIYSPETFSLVVFCQKMTEDFNAIQTDGRTLDLQIIGTPYDACLDVKLLSYSLSNLISNAFKFSAKKQGPQLTLYFKTTEIKLSVKDFGIGVPEGELSNLFHPFFRAENVTDIKGTGLGLSIAKEYAEINKGVISAKSNLGMGSTFEIIFKHDWL